MPTAPVQSRRRLMMAHLNHPHRAIHDSTATKQLHPETGRQVLVYCTAEESAQLFQLLLLCKSRLPLPYKDKDGHNKTWCWVIMWPAPNDQQRPSGAVAVQ
jgi:hypothetical protein